MTTSVVTNGSLMDWPRVRTLLPRLDWFVLSVDSVDPGTLRRIGRYDRHGPLSGHRYLEICRMVHDNEVNL